MKAAILLAKNVFASLEITAVASAIDAGIQKEIHGSGRPSSSTQQKTALAISNKQFNDMIKIVQAPEDPNILLKGVTKTI